MVPKRKLGKILSAKEKKKAGQAEKTDMSSAPALIISRDLSKSFFFLCCRNLTVDLGDIA
jgi:hypothetical protein